jgi:predicted nicotinamide N-methyase
MNRIPALPIVRGEWHHFASELRACNSLLLQFPQRMFDFRSADMSIDILVNQDMADVGSSVWDAEIILAHHIFDNFHYLNQHDSLSVLELGAGTAVASLMLAKCAEQNHRNLRVCLQEFDDSRAALGLNGAKLNSLSATHIRSVVGRWGDPSLHQLLVPTTDTSVSSSESKYPLVIAADVLYGEQSDWGNLLTTVFASISLGGTLLICVEQRRPDFSDFFSRAAAHFEYSSLVRHEIHSDSSEIDPEIAVCNSDTVFWIFQCRGFRG